MKKLIVTLAVVLGISLSGNAQYFEQGGGLFERGMVSDEEFYGTSGFRDGGLLLPGLPNHGLDTNQDPLSGGIALLAGLGAAYLVAKKRKED